MPWYSFCSSLFDTVLFNWRTGVEIIALSTIIYYFSLWLKHDKQKNLLFYFYSYCAVFLGANYAQLPTVSYLIFLTAPIAIMLFILFHQDTLQKNFIALRNVTPINIHNNDWLETLVRSCLVATNNNKEIYCVIEHTQSLATLINTPLALTLDVQQNLLEMMLESSTFEQKQLIWVNSHGKLLGINATWNTSEHAQGDYAQIPAWQQDAVLCTSKTDAIVFSISPINHTFSIVAQGKIFNDITALHALKTIKKYVTATHASSQKEIIHETISKKNHAQQRNT